MRKVYNLEWFLYPSFIQENGPARSFNLDDRYVTHFNKDASVRVYYVSISGNIRLNTVI